MSDRVKVLFLCTGVGIMNRGIESFFREAFDGLKGAGGLDAKLVKGAGYASDDEWPVKVLPRTGSIAPVLGRMMRRNAYVAEQWSSYPGVALRIAKFRPDVVFYSDANVGFLLYWTRKYLGVPFRLLFSNGAPSPPPYARLEFVQQVTPDYLDRAIASGESRDRHVMVPYGIGVPACPEMNLHQRDSIRQQLGMPTDRSVVLSVGWIARQHKRMDYVIREIASLPEPRPYLQLLGALDSASPEIISLGHELLGPSGIGIASVPYESVNRYYQAADVFVLASLAEGFGRVYLEALMNGLPVVAHRFPVSEFVLGEEGVLKDLSQPGELAKALSEALVQTRDQGSIERRWRSVRDRFSWPALAPQYLQMFQHAAYAPIPRPVPRVVM